MLICRHSIAIIFPILNFSCDLNLLIEISCQKNFQAGENPTPVCLVRAYAKGKKKYSTVVAKEDSIKFQMQITNVLRANIDNLQRKKKADKKN